MNTEERSSKMGTAHMNTNSKVGLMDSNVAIATNAFWRINNCWNGHGHCTVGKALQTLSGAKNLVGPHRSIYWKIDQLINDIVYKQADPIDNDQQQVS
jgi:hypothetical protein